MSRLIDMLTYKEVRTTSHPSRSPSRVSSLADRGSRSETGSIYLTRPDSNNVNSAPLVRQAAPTDPQGVYDIAGSVFAKYRRHDGTTIISTISECSYHRIFFTEVSFPLEESDTPLEPLKRVRPENDPISEEDNSLVRQLFGSDLEGEETQPWNERVSHKWQELIRNGLPTDQWEVLLKKYSPPETVAFLRAPTLNLECKVALKNNSIAKRDEYNYKNHDQMGRALYALGEAISDLLESAAQNSLNPEVGLAITKVNDGARILADLFYRFSLARRAQITPALNLIAKNTADTIPADNFLFGSSFGEEIKKVTSMASKDIIRTPIVLSKRVQQPIKQPVVPAKSGNPRVPMRYSRPATRRTGASSNSRRISYRSRSHSRRR